MFNFSKTHLILILYLCIFRGRGYVELPYAEMDSEEKLERDQHKELYDM